AFAGFADWRPIGSVAKLQSGYAFKSESFKTSGVRLLRNTNVLPGKVYWDDTAFLSNEDGERFPGYALVSGDVLISLDRPLISSGIKVARVGENDVPALLVQRVGRFLLNSEEVDAEYLYAFLQSARFIAEISGHEQSLGVPHISPTQVEAIELPLPSIAEQRSLSSRLKAQLAEVDAIQQAAAARLAEIRRMPQRLLAQAFNTKGDTP
ncbi:MAG: restriction endonuclease subunit S, partial [Dokdonella sp.]